LKKIILAAAVSALAIMAVASSASAGGGTAITATSAAPKTFSGTYSATFARRSERHHQRDEPDQH
jgi:opacity protein-like surface antigen